MSVRTIAIDSLIPSFSFSVVPFTAAHVESINDARHLLYRVYVVEEGWLPSDTNPSGLKVSRLPDGREILEDDFDAHALWCTTYHGKTIAACGRLLDRSRGQKFEAEHYAATPTMRAELCVSKRPNLVEMSRAATCPQYRSTSVFFFSLLETIKFMHEHGLGAFTLSSNEKLVRMFKFVGFVQIDGVNFKYEERDEKEVTMLVAELSSFDNAVQLLTHIASKKKLKAFL